MEKNSLKKWMKNIQRMDDNKKGSDILQSHRKNFELLLAAVEQCNHWLQELE